MTTTGISELPSGYRVDPVLGAWVSLPWPSDPDEKYELAVSSLGPDLIAWSEGRTDEPGFTDYLSGEPWRWTPGQRRFIVLWYAYDENGRWLYRSGVKRGAKGTGKDPFGAALCMIELIGRSQLVPDGEGGYTGVRHLLPLVQIASNSEAQSKDMLRICNALIGREARAYYRVDCGETRTILKDGGRLEVLTASEKSAEGDPATFIALNESHHMTSSSGGEKVADVARRNVGKSPSSIQARLCEFTNAHQQGSGSVAERTYEAWQAQVKSPKLLQDILYDSIEADPTIDIMSHEGRMRGIGQAYQDAPWSDHVRIEAEMLDTRTSAGDTIRYYLNGLAAAEDAWVDPRKWDSLGDASVVVADGEQIAMFLDCSKSTDATGLVACRISDGHVFTLGMWQRPHGSRGADWLVPRHEVDNAVRMAFETFKVAWFGVDPSPARDDSDESLYWGELTDEWHRDFRRKVALWATPGTTTGSAVTFDMRMSKPGGLKRNVSFTEEAMATVQAVDEETDIDRGIRPFTHDAHAGLRMHVHNAKRRPNQWGFTLGKKTRDSGDLVDLAVCLVGARLGRRIVMNAGKNRKTRNTGRVIVM